MIESNKVIGEKEYCMKTNRERFTEVFGFEPTGTICNDVDCVKCPCNQYDDEVCREKAADFWDEPYKGKDRGNSWIPFNIKEKSKEEKVYIVNGNDFIIEEPTPDDNEEIYVSFNGKVFMDTYIKDDYCYGYLKSGIRIVRGMAWTPKLNPYIPETEEQ